MNCQEFEIEVDALARGALMDAAARAEATAHAEGCERCSALLANERALTAGLRALASGTRNAEAPARVESALLAAFRANAGTRVTNDGGEAAPLFAATHARGEVVRPWSWVKTVAAASVAAAAALAFYMIIPPDFSLSPAPRGEAAKAVGTAPSRPPAVGGAGESERPTVENSSRLTADDAEPVTSQPSEVAADSKNHRASSHPRAVRATNAVYDSGGSRLGSRGGPRADSQEVFTEFIPLAQGGAFAQSEAAHIVRVELPRSALTSFGIPFNAESAGGRVKADVLLGEDGIARAIRFVR